MTICGRLATDNILSDDLSFNYAVRGYRLMWKNFKAMPILLKFLTAHALACIVLVLASIFPFGSFRIHGQYVTHSEWWSTGIGVYVSIFGTLMAIAGYLLISKKRFSRHMYISVVPLALVAPYLKSGEFIPAIFGVAVTLMLATYMFLKASVKEYFASNQHMQKNRPAAGR